MAVLEELRHTLKVKRINDELLEHLASTLGWLLRYAEKNNIALPEKDKIVLALDRAMEIAEKLPSHQPFCNNQNEQPSDQHCQVFGSVPSEGVQMRLFRKSSCLLLSLYPKVAINLIAFSYVLKHAE